jgi:D-alanine--D-alanine ligase
MEIKKKSKKVGVLIGGPSTEREISFKSGKAVFEALKGAEVEVVAIDIVTDDRKHNIELLKQHELDIVFIALHGKFGEDGGIQDILEEMGLPYTGSGIKASALAMDKIASRRIFEQKGISVPRYRVINKPEWRRGQRLAAVFNFPVVVKPASNGSRIGLSIIGNEKDFDQALRLAFSFDDRIIIEEYLQGREMTVGIFDDAALPVIEIIPKHQFFDYEAKYQSGLTDYKVPAQIDEPTCRKIQNAGLAAHRALGCAGFSRIDIILKDDIPFVLEVNTIPGFTSTSLLPKAAKLAGIEFTDLCLRLLKLAYEKTETKYTHSSAG